MTVTDPEEVKDAVRHDIGRRIAKHRKATGLSQTELALVIGTQKSEISRWENGWRRPSLEAIARIADALGVDWRILEYGHTDPV
jgi:transcriptional regulator with XRE-family HTH domain